MSWKIRSWPWALGPLPRLMIGTFARSVISPHTWSGTSSSRMAIAPGLFQRLRIVHDLLGLSCALLPCRRKPPRLETLCGVRPRWPMTGMPAATMARTREHDFLPALQLDAVAGGLGHEAARR